MPGEKVEYFQMYIHLYTSENINIYYMKYLKTFEAKKVTIKSSVFGQSKKSVGKETDIKKICEKYDIINYTINSDGSIDVEYDVYLSALDLTKLPLKFRNVSGNFYCSDNQLTTLEDGPKSVGGDFYCQYNQLTTLKGVPKNVGGDFDCSGNKLTTLEGAPESIGGYFSCTDNQLTTLEGCPQIVSGYFDFRDNELVNFHGFPEDFEGAIHFGGNPVSEIYKLFNDVKCIRWINEFDVIQGDSVIMDRLEEVYHQLGMKMINLKNYKIID